VGRVPSGWVNCQGKFVVIKHDGVNVLKKLGNNSNPLIARAYAYIGMPTLSNYTIEADLLGTRVRNDLPDMGLINSRYTLMLDGNKQQLRLMSWEALPRLDKGIPFKWSANKWYHMKLTVEPAKDKAHLKARCGPRAKRSPLPGLPNSKTLAQIWRVARLSMGTPPAFWTRPSARKSCTPM